MYFTQVVAVLQETWNWDFMMRSVLVAEARATTS